VTARRVGFAILGTLAFLAPPAAAHYGVPKTWWIDEKTAVKRLRAVVKQRYEPSAFQRFSGRCRGLDERATRNGQFVYQHFACSARIRLNGINFSFFYRVHVTGPHGRITLGG
jgi:hypothetical protein